MTWKPTTIPWDKCSDERKELLAQAWLIGDLSYKFDPVQKQDAAQVKKWWAETPEAAQRWVALDCSRRYGKDTMMGVLAAEICIQFPGCRIPYGAPTQKDVEEILEDSFMPMMADAPPDLAPEWNKAKSRWVFPNGSRLVMVGFDLYPNRARGRGLQAFFLTEPGFFDDLTSVLRRIIIPQGLTHPHMRGVMGSTPPESPSHPWSETWVPLAKARGRHIHRTIWDNPRVPDRTKRAFIEETGGEGSSDTRREWYAEHVVDVKRAVIPEFSEGEQVQEGTQLISATEQAICVPMERPKWFDAYTVLDPGWEDQCAALFGYYDFDNAMVVIEDEFCESHANTDKVAAFIKAKERELWEKSPRWHMGQVKPQPYTRYSDTDSRMRGDLLQLHQLQFNATKKDNLSAQVNHLRVVVQQRQIRIHPRCTILRSHLRSGIWNKARTKFDASDEFGHFDTLACLIYFVRMVNRQRNPNPPADYQLSGDHFVHPDRVKADQAKRLGAMFKRPNKKAKPPQWRGM